MKNTENIFVCPVCGESSFTVVFGVKDYLLTGEIFNVSRCDACEFLITLPFPPPEKIGSYYKAEEYVSHSGTNRGIINSLYHIVKPINLKKKRKIADRFSLNMSLLDIGCGTGDFLSHCRDNGWDVKGIEPDKDARSYAISSHGLDILDLSGFSQFNSNSFDVITMWHSLEHVYDLKTMLNEINRTLKQDGTLIVAVPNHESYDAEHYGEFWAAYDVPRHLYHFNKKTLGRLFNKINMNVIKIIPGIFDSYYISLLSEKNKNNTYPFFKGFKNGFLSNYYARSKNDNYSSLIYILKTKKMAI